MRLAAAIASMTCCGAPAGAEARPSGPIVAVGPATSFAARCLAAAALDLGLTYVAPPVPCAPATGAASSTASMHSMNVSRERPRTADLLFRRPAGLADGLAQKEPALHADDRVISPNNMVPPLLRDT